MKRLNDYIVEKQQINEGSLIGDIIRKLLDTTLSWIGSAAKWVADTCKEAAAEGWNTFKNTNEKLWLEYCKETGYNGPKPKNEREFNELLAKRYFSKESFNDDAFKDFKTHAKLLGMNKDATALSLCGYYQTVAAENTKKPKTLKVCVEKLNELLEEDLKGTTKKRISDVIAEIEKKIKK